MKELTLDQVPPYGYMYDAFQRVGLARKPPTQWRPLPGQPDWNAWLVDTEGLIRDNLWPEYVVGSGWQGPKSLLEAAIPLIKLELELMRRFREKYFEEVGSSDGSKHSTLFETEDSDDWRKTLLLHWPQLPLRPDAFTRILEETLFEKLNWVIPDLKWTFQRPRAYQMALLIGGTVDSFPNALAPSANTPSLISGHCLQGLFVGANVYANLVAAAPAVASGGKALLQHWSACIGDRRVMAGVHYPLDSIASWIVAMRLVDRVFDTPGIRDFIREAITKHSPLYEYLVERRAADRDVELKYASAWKKLEEALA